jgi:hypothetical protein
MNNYGYYPIHTHELTTKALVPGAKRGGAGKKVEVIQWTDE